MIVKRITVILSFFLLVKEGKCQSVIEKGFGIQAGYAYQGMNRIDLGVNYLFAKNEAYSSVRTKRDNDSTPEYKSYVSKYSIVSYGLNLSAHGFFNGTEFIFGQSIGCNIGKAWNNGLGLNTGIGVANYSNSDFRLNPTIGLSLGEIIYLNYSYAIPFNNQTQTFISPNQFGITIRYNLAVIKVILNNLR